MNRLEPEVDAPYGTPLKVTPFRLKPRILPEFVSTTVAPSEQTTSRCSRRVGALETGGLVAAANPAKVPGASTGTMLPAAAAAIPFMSVRRLFE
jgi:hypothetical protein